MEEQAPWTHVPVLLKEVVELLRPNSRMEIIDATVGGGGHAEALLEAGATVIGIDRDRHALEVAAARLARFGKKFRPLRATFRELVSSNLPPVDGFLADLGVSSGQLDDAERGFSFHRDGPLDMRMSSEGMTAAQFIAQTPEKELADIIYELGQEHFSRTIARELKKVLPQTTLQAAEAVKHAVPRSAYPRTRHVATRTFQALRMAINHERENLEALLEGVPRLLRPGGRAAIISFHSLDDRLVKLATRMWCGRSESNFRSLTKRPLAPSRTEQRINRRSRSAKLRAVERVR